ncbi:hypothetical protein ACJ2A9_05505 [Anaerobacillus sp. MEB173]|uniref:hypothetical protein n=1 Tax=Anaerobacillus sp. MEB173 TaxID=3383345 RepID=UPI003F90888A
MQSKNFGLDIDGTVTSPSAFIPYLNKHFNKNITLQDITQYELAPLLNVTNEQFWSWMKKHERNIYANVDLAKDVHHALTDWKETHQIVYISARGEHLLETTEQWFTKNNLPFHHIELTGQHDKIAAVKKHSIDIFFEDKHDNACSIAEECEIPVILMDTPYNRDPIPTNVIRVQSWLEAKNWVNNWLKGSI